MSEQTILLHDRILSHDPLYLNNIFGFIANYHNKNIKVHYEISVRHLTGAEGGSALYIIDREQVSVNNIAGGEGMLYEMADLMAKAFYPAIVRINKEHITGLNNHPDIMARCGQVVQKLKDYYVGKMAKAFIYQYEGHFTNAEKIIKGFQQDFFYQLYFLPVHVEYDHEFKAQFTHEVYLDGNTAIPFQLSLQLDRTYTKTEKAVVNVVGKEIFLKNNRTERQGPATIKIQYQLYVEDHTIFSIVGEATYCTAENKMETVVFELYHLNTQNRITAKHPSLEGGGLPGKNNIIISEEKIAPKKRWFNI